jgi:hypothetical protein
LTKVRRAGGACGRQRAAGAVRSEVRRQGRNWGRLLGEAYADQPMYAACAADKGDKAKEARVDNPSATPKEITRETKFPSSLGCREANR